MPDQSPDETFQTYLKRTFGPESDHYRRVVPHLVRRLSDADPGSDVATSFRLWRESIDVNVSKVESAVAETVVDLDLDLDPGDRAEELLYCLQSYYALVLQFDRIANVARLVDGPDPGPDDYPALRSAYGNLLDQPEDRLFHGWLAGEALDAAPFRDLADAMGEAPPRDGDEDAFKDLYQALVGNPFRKAMGEFYTRGWVADLILDAIDYDGGTLLDPACGSGAFLVKAAGRRLRDDPDPDPDAVECVHGFDLNPVAVMAAKSNLLGVLAGRLDRGALRPDELASVTLPVHWTNAIVWTEPDLSGNNVTLLSPYTELNVPFDPDAAVEKIRDDVADWAAGRSFDGVVDDGWLEAVSRSFAAPLARPPFDCVVGNPPWVSPDRMPKSYRDRVADLLEESGFLQPFQPDYLTNRFPNRQFVAALPFFEVTMDRYLADGGTCAFLVTSSLLKSMNGGGFREQLQDWRVDRLLDFTPYTDVHQHASSWAFVPVIRKSPDDGTETRVEFFLPTDGEAPAHRGSCRTTTTPDVTLHVCSWDVDLSDVPFLPDDPRSPWFTAPPHVLDAYRTIMEGTPHVGEHARFTRGIVTGRNAVYLLEDVSRRDGHVEARSGASNGTVTLESDLVYPFVEGKHLSAWAFDHTHLLVPYDVPAWEPIPEAELAAAHPNAAAYLRANRETLEDRRTHTITSRMAGGSPFYVVETRDVLGERPVVGIREVAPHLEAAVIPATIDDPVLGERESVVAHTLNFVVPASEDEAHYLAGLLNSWPLRTMAYDLAQPKGGRPGKRYDMFLLSSLPIPAFDPDDDRHRAVADLAREAHAAVREGDDPEGVERRLNAVVCEDLFGLPPAQREALRDHYERLAYTPG